MTNILKHSQKHTPEVFHKNIHRKTPVLESLLNNVGGLQVSALLKRDSNTGVFL